MEVIFVLLAVLAVVCVVQVRNKYVFGYPRMKDCDKINVNPVPWWHKLIAASAIVALFVIAVLVLWSMEQ